MSKTKDAFLIPTETRNVQTDQIDRAGARGIARLINAEDFNAARAVKAAAKNLEKAILLAAETYLNGNKLIFIGAGTSGRLGVLEAVECVPTFGTDPKQIIGIMAGGKSAVFRSKEGAEDDAEQGAKDVLRKARKGDLVFGLTASGVTPYVLGALKAAQERGAKTVLLCCNPLADPHRAQLFIALPTGPEALCGSTRMKAGSATKMALNAITTGAMILAGKTYHNLMVDVQATNRKLRARAARLVCALAGVNAQQAQTLLTRAGGGVKTAVVMSRLGISRAKAEALLKEKNGFLKDALNEK